MFARVFAQKYIEEDGPVPTTILCAMKNGAYTLSSWVEHMQTHTLERFALFPSYVQIISATLAF